MPSSDSASKKTAIKTVRSPRSGAEIPVGAHAKNTGGKKGRSGRKPDAWKSRLREIVSSDVVLDELEQVLADSRHPAYVGAIKYATEHGFGKATETVEISGKDGQPVQVQVWRFGKREVAF